MRGCVTEFNPSDMGIFPNGQVDGRRVSEYYCQMIKFIFQNPVNGVNMSF